MTMRCYVTDADGRCPNTKRVRFLQWLDAVLQTWSFQWWVCPPHYGLYDTLGASPGGNQDAR